MMSDPSRAEQKNPVMIAHEGAIFNLNGGSIFTGNGTLMRFVTWPGAGCRMVGGHMGFVYPGVAFNPHVHPISEDCVCSLVGRGEGYLVDKYVDLAPGDMLYAPAGVMHGHGNLRGHTADFVNFGVASPPQFDLYQWAGYFKEGKFDQDAIKEGLLAPGKRDLVIGDEIQLGEVPEWGEERAQWKTPQQVRETGAIFNINQGKPYTCFGPETRFVVAPFTGSHMISATVIVHQPGETFEPHSHLISDSAELILKGKGQVYVNGRWSEVKAGDILYTPPLVEHASRNPSGNSEPMVMLSYAAPPPFDLYQRAGIFADGEFVGV